MHHPHDDSTNGHGQRNSLVAASENDRKKLSITDVDLGERIVLALLCTAVDRTFPSRKEAAYQLGVLDTRLSKWLNPDSHERFPVIALMRHRKLFTAFATVAHEHGYAVRDLDQWERLKLVTVRMVKVLCMRVERQLKRDLKAAAL